MRRRRACVRACVLPTHGMRLLVGERVCRSLVIIVHYNAVFCVSQPCPTSLRHAHACAVPAPCLLAAFVPFRHDCSVPAVMSACTRSTFACRLRVVPAMPALCLPSCPHRVMLRAIHAPCTAFAPRSLRVVLVVSRHARLPDGGESSSSASCPLVAVLAVLPFMPSHCRSACVSACQSVRVTVRPAR